MDILLISNEDTCRSRIAQELLHTFGRGMNISTAGVMEGNCVPDAVCNVMEQNGYSISRKKPSGVGAYAHRSWDYVVTLCKEAEEELNFLPSMPNGRRILTLKTLLKIVFQARVNRSNK